MIFVPFTGFAVDPATGRLKKDICYIRADVVGCFEPVKRRHEDSVYNLTFIQYGIGGANFGTYVQETCDIVRTKLENAMKQYACHPDAAAK